ncbi:MAG: substrate-binding domain-containing protein [Oscillospiraceae bacterium]|nr:substrate-binding domain-containing protein [Oscillospiraceae bacterium]
MKKKLLAVLLVVCVVLSLAACSKSGSTSTSANKIYILTPSEDHGWTGSVATFAKAKAKEINDAGKYVAEVKTASSANEQIQQIEDIVANKSDVVGVAILPMDDTVGSAIKQLADAKIPYTAFDRIIADVASTAVANVKGDNEGIGAATAAYFVSKGLQPGERVYVYQGDTSSVTTTRTQGFYDYLLGNLAYDGKTIDESAKWTQDQINDAITESGAMNWSRQATKEHFESLMSGSANADIKWFYTQDDELAMGILEALNGSAIDDATKATILGNQPVISAAGGLKELYDVLKGSLYPELYQQLGGFMSVTYNPSMIQTCVQDLLDSLDGKTVTQDHVIECKIVDDSNVNDYEPFS